MAYAVVSPQSERSASHATAKEDKVIGLNAKLMSLSHLTGHCLQGFVVDLPLSTADTADQMVMRRQTRNLIVGFTIAGIGGHDDSQLHKQPQGTIDRRAINRAVGLPNSQIHLSERSVPLSGANRFKNECALPCDAMAGIPERFFPPQLVVCHRE